MDPPPSATHAGALHNGSLIALSISNFKKTWLPEGSIFVLSLAGKTGWVVYLFPHMLESTSCFPNDSRELSFLF